MNLFESTWTKKSLGFMDKVSSAMEEYTEKHSGTTDEEYLAFLKKLSFRTDVELDELDELWCQSGDYLHYHQREDDVQRIVQWMIESGLVKSNDIYAGDQTDFERMQNEGAQEENDDLHKVIDLLPRVANVLPDDIMDDLEHFVDSSSVASLHDLLPVIDAYADKNRYVGALASTIRELSASNVDEGYTIMPDIDREKYTNREAEGLEGPFVMRNGKVLYYDKSAGKYYDPDTDFYVSDEEYFAMDKKSEFSSESIGRPQHDTTIPTDGVDAEDPDLDAFDDEVEESSHMRRMMDSMDDVEHLAKDEVDDIYDLDESTGPSVADTWSKIKDWDAKALAGYARRVGLPDDVVNPIVRDPESLVDEIMGHLFDENWMIELMDAGMLDEDSDGAAPLKKSDVNRVLKDLGLQRITAQYKDHRGNYKNRALGGSGIYVAGKSPLDVTNHAQEKEARVMRKVIEALANIGLFVDDEASKRSAGTLFKFKQTSRSTEYLYAGFHDYPKYSGYDMDSSYMNTWLIFTWTKS